MMNKHSKNFASAIHDEGMEVLPVELVHAEEVILETPPLALVEEPDGYDPYNSAQDFRFRLERQMTLEGIELPSILKTQGF